MEDRAQLYDASEAKQKAQVTLGLARLGPCQNLAEALRLHGFGVFWGVSLTMRQSNFDPKGDWVTHDVKHLQGKEGVR